MHDSTHWRCRNSPNWPPSMDGFENFTSSLYIFIVCIYYTTDHVIRNIFQSSLLTNDRKYMSICIWWNRTQLKCVVSGIPADSTPTSINESPRSTGRWLPLAREKNMTRLNSRVGWIRCLGKICGYVYWSLPVMAYGCVHNSPRKTWLVRKYK